MPALRHLQLRWQSIACLIAHNEVGVVTEPFIVRGGETSNFGSESSHPHPDGERARPRGSWNESRLVFLGDRVEQWLNGVKVVDHSMSSDKSGDKGSERNLEKHWSVWKRDGVFVRIRPDGAPTHYRKLEVRRL